MAGKDGAHERLVAEVADLVFHSMIALAQFGLRPATCWRTGAPRRPCRAWTNSPSRKASSRDRREAEWTTP
jgi:phosphoribosyl-ATP pyrophosphohydrolase